MMGNLDTVPSLLLPYHFDAAIRPPEPFLDARYSRLVEIIDNSLPGTTLAMVGFWPSRHSHILDAKTVELLGTEKQNLDIDMFLPVSRTDSEQWERIHAEGYSLEEQSQSPNIERVILPVGGNQQIVFFNGFTYLSPELSLLPEDQLKSVISQAFYNHLPPDHRFQKVGRTGDSLVVIGENAARWGSNRRDQPVNEAQPYIEIMPLVVKSPHQEYLDSMLEKYGYSPDLNPLYCRVYQGDYVPLDLHLYQPEHRSFGMSGLPDINIDYINESPKNALNWIRWEVKAIALYAQLSDPLSNLTDFIAPQLALLMDHVDIIATSQPNILDDTQMVDKINETFSTIAQVITKRFGIKVNEVLLAKS